MTNEQSSTMYFDFDYTSDQDQEQEQFIYLNEEYGEQNDSMDQSTEFLDSESDEMDYETSVDELNMELDSINELLEMQSQSMNEFHKILEDLSINLNRLNHSKENGCQKYEEVIQLCQKVQKIQCEISETMDKAVTIYKANAVYDQILLTTVKEHYNMQSSIELERKAIYHVDVEEIKKKGEMTVETLKTGLYEKENLVKIVSGAVSVLKTQIGMNEESDIVFLNEKILKLEESKLTAQQNLLMVQEEYKNIQEMNHKRDIERTNEVTNINSQIEEINSLLNNEKVLINAQNEKISQLKNVVQESTIYCNELKEKIQTEEVAIEMVNKEIDAKRNQYCNFESEISKIKDIVSNLSTILIKLEDKKVAIEKNKSMLSTYKNDLEIKTSDKLMLKLKIDTVDTKIKLIDDSLKSQLNRNSMLQRNINLLSLQITQIDSLIQEESVGSTDKNKLNEELEDIKRKNRVSKIEMEGLNHQIHMARQKFEALMEEKLAVIEKLNLENTKVKESESVLKQREWECYMESTIMDTTYERMLNDLKTKSSEFKVLKDVLEKIALHQSELHQLQIKCNDEKNALSEMNSTNLGKKLLEVQNLERSIGIDLEVKDDELCQVKDEFLMIRDEINALESFNKNSAKYLEQFQCEQFLLETHTGWLKSLIQEGKKKKCVTPHNPCQENTDDIFISSDAEEDEYKTSCFDSDSTISVVKGDEYRHFVATIPIQIQSMKSTKKVKNNKNEGILHEVDDSN